jgi:hypothetical protein
LAFGLSFRHSLIDNFLSYLPSLRNLTFINKI